MDLNENVEEYLERFYEILDSMILEMTSIDVDNNISQSFILQMIALSGAGIDFSSNLLNHSNNAGIEQLAQNMIDFYTRTIEDLNHIYTRCANISNPNTDIVNYNRAYNYIIENMFVNMSNAVISDDVNINYISEMIPYHLGAVSLIRNAMRFQLCGELMPILRELRIQHSQFVNELRSIYDGVS